MSKVVIAITTVKADFPSTTVAGKYHFSIQDVNGNVIQSQDVDGLEADFSGVADGSYVAVAVRNDANGVNLGSGISQNFTVVTAAPVPVDTPIQIDVPSALTITVSAE